MNTILYIYIYICPSWADAPRAPPEPGRPPGEWPLEPYYTILHICIFMSISMSISMYAYTYLYLYTCIYIYIYIGPPRSRLETEEPGAAAVRRAAI